MEIDAMDSESLEWLGAQRGLVSTVAEAIEHGV